MRWAKAPNTTPHGAAFQNSISNKFPLHTSTSKRAFVSGKISLSQAWPSKCYQVKQFQDSFFWNNGTFEFLYSFCTEEILEAAKKRDWLLFCYRFSIHLSAILQTIKSFLFWNLAWRYDSLLLRKANGGFGWSEYCITRIFDENFLEFLIELNDCWDFSRLTFPSPNFLFRSQWILPYKNSRTFQDAPERSPPVFWLNTL